MWPSEIHVDSALPNPLPDSHNFALSVVDGGMFHWRQRSGILWKLRPEPWREGSSDDGCSPVDVGSSFFNG
jgi:hypothetical protein